MEDTASLTLGKRILYHRKRLGLTQDQLAEKMGVTAQAVSKWEHDLSCPDVTAVPRLAELFGISTDELLGVPRAAEEPRKSHVGEGLTVVRNYKSCGWGRERCDREGHAVFLRPRVDSAIMGSASTGISTSSTKLKMISTFCLRLPPDLSGA